jgi:hypothetical protein
LKDTVSTSPHLEEPGWYPTAGAVVALATLMGKRLCRRLNRKVFIAVFALVDVTKLRGVASKQAVYLRQRRGEKAASRIRRTFKQPLTQARGLLPAVAFCHVVFFLELSVDWDHIKMHFERLPLRFF